MPTQQPDLTEDQKKERLKYALDYIKELEKNRHAFRDLQIKSAQSVIVWSMAVLVALIGWVSTVLTKNVTLPSYINHILIFAIVFLLSSAFFAIYVQKSMSRGFVNGTKIWIDSIKSNKTEIEVLECLIEQTECISNQFEKEKEGRRILLIISQSLYILAPLFLSISLIISICFPTHTHESAEIHAPMPVSPSPLQIQPIQACPHTSKPKKLSSLSHNSLSHTQQVTNISVNLKTPS